MSKNQCSKLIEYISYFEDDTIEFCKWHGSKKHEDGMHSVAYPIYDDKIGSNIDISRLQMMQKILKH